MSYVYNVQYMQHGCCCAMCVHRMFFCFVSLCCIIGVAHVFACICVCMRVWKREYRYWGSKNNHIETHYSISKTQNSKRVLAYSRITVGLSAHVCLCIRVSVCCLYFKHTLRLRHNTFRFYIHTVSWYWASNWQWYLAVYATHRHIYTEYTRPYGFRSDPFPFQFIIGIIHKLQSTTLLRFLIIVSYQVC